MAKKQDKLIQNDEISLSKLANNNKEPEDGVELITDVEMYEELSEEAKKKQERAIASMREKAMAVVDTKKLDYAMKAIEATGHGMDILSDKNVWDRIRKRTSTAQDLKFLTEAMKLNLQNIDALFRMGSINTAHDAGERFVAVQWGSGDDTTKVVIKK